MKTNNLKHTVTKSDINYYEQKADIVVKIRLNDEFKNGYQDFSITSSIYEAGRRGDRSFLSGGCCHDEILKEFPDFKIFVELHSSDHSGVPMSAVENGFYYLRNGFNDTKTTDSNFKKEYCSYYRMTGRQFDKLNESENKLEFSILLNDLGILKGWNLQAKKGIRLLEKMTNKKFINDSKKTQYTKPKDDEIKQFTKKTEKGFYSLENKRKRAKEKRKQNKIKVINALKEDCLKTEIKAREKKEVKLFILSHIEKLNSKKRNKFSLDFTFDNFIYYDHTKEVCFNWLGYKNTISEYEYNLFCNSLSEYNFNKLPNGISFSLNGKKTFTKK